METLQEHLRGKRKGDFARELGIAPVYLSQILSGYRRPGFDLMVKIQQATSGAVPVDSWANKKERS